MRPHIKFIQKRYLIGESENLDAIAAAHRESFPDKAQAKIDEADLICEHIFDLLGSGPKKLSPEKKGPQLIDWHSDFKSGHRWDSRKFYRNIRYGHIESVDVKIPWELSRFQHLNILGQAYLLTKNKKYSAEFIDQISDWVKNNPVGFGVNWACTMDVAIRAINWLVAVEYFSNKGVLSQDFLNEFYNSIYEHGKFIYSHLEHSSRGNANNHYIANIAGLFLISVYCHFFDKSKEWQDFALRELSKEIENQVYQDGCSFEASTAYHRLALELFFYCILLGERANIEFPAQYRAKLKKMFEFSLHSIKPNGMIPQIGDNDNGRLLLFDKRPVLEHKYLLRLASIYYNDSDFKPPQLDFGEEAFWVFGKKGKEIYDNLPHRGEPVASKAFPDAGWYVLRNNNDHCLISCGSNGQGGNGGHAHNDKLSFELMLDGRDIIVDPGTYIYTAYPNERNKFRSTEYHNTIKFDGYEQNEINPNAIFSLPDRVKIVNAVLTETDDNVTFQGEIRYSGLIHNRTIIFGKRNSNLQITDLISRGKAVDAKLTFHLSPDVFFHDGSIFSKATEKRIASIEIPGHILEKSEYDYSPEYGVKVKAECLAANISSADGVKTVNTYINRS